MYIFLDVDGVLNKSSQWKKMYSLDGECIKNFCQFVNKVNGQVILTSSWRTGFIGTNSNDNTLQIKQLEQYLGEYGVQIKDKTPILKGRKRDKEIERYLYLNTSFENNHRYIIIDDDRNEFEHVDEHNYFTDAKSGFTARDIKSAYKNIVR